MTVAIDWENLGFSYMKLPYRYIAHYKNGQWDQGELTEDATLHISESSPSLQKNSVQIHLTDFPSLPWIIFEIFL